MATIQTKIALRRDDLSNWNTVSSQILNAGEIAIVVDESGNENLKIGNGLSSFGQLPYMYANAFTSKSISQGSIVKSSPTSLVAGVLLEADGDYNVVNGIQAHAKNGDDYAYVFNGDNVSPQLTDIKARYESHGKGTFNINPIGGANGFYIGEKSLSSLMSEGSTKVNAGIYGTALTALESLSVVKIAAEDYYALVANEQTREDVLYIVSSDTLNAYDSRVENVAAPVASTDAANKQYVDKSVNDATAKIPLSASQLKNDKFLELSSATNQRILINSGKSITITGAETSSTASITLTSAGFMQLSGSDGGIELTDGSFIDVNNVSGRVEINDGAYLGMTQGFEQICAYVKSATAAPPAGTTATNLVQFIDSKVTPAKESADKKIFIDDLSTETLSIQHIAADNYYKIVASNPEQLLSNKMYIVSSDYINAYGGRVRYVANPEADDDAVTKRYADAIRADIPLSVSQLENDNGFLSSVAWNDVSATAPAMLQLTSAVDQRISVAAGRSIYAVAADAQDAARVDLTAGYVQLSGAKSGTSFIGGAYIDVNKDGRIELNEDSFINCTNGFEQICAYVATDATKSKAGIRTSTPPSGTTPVNLVQFIDSKKYYPLVTAQLQVSGDALSCSVQDHAVTTIEISSAATPVIVQMPAKSQYGARDFILRVEVSSSTAPSFTFMGFDETISFDSDSDDWMTIEPGLNLISFTETK